MTGSKLVWSDDFDGPAGAPPSLHWWTPELGPGGERQLQTYTAPPANAMLDGASRLAVEARRESDGTVTSARLVTKGRVRVRYGRVEARMRVPEGRGVWPAFWMLGASAVPAGCPARAAVTALVVAAAMLVAPIGGRRASP